MMKIDYLLSVKAVFAVLILVVCFPAMGQNDTLVSPNSTNSEVFEYGNIERANVSDVNALEKRMDILETMVKSDAENAFIIRKNLNKFRNENVMGIAFSVAGVGLSSLGTVLATASGDQGVGVALTIVGGCSAIVGLVLFIDSYKWLRSSRVKLSDKGLGVKYNF